MTPEGKVLADYIGSGLSALGFPVKRLIKEDWGWVVEISNADFPLWVGCGFSGLSDDGLHCFIRPNKPIIWRWFNRVNTVPVVEALARAIEVLITQSGDAQEVSWSEE